MKRSKNAKIGIVVALLLLVVGFATVTAVLTLTGTIKFQGNEDEFNENLVFVGDDDEAKHATITSSLEKTGGTVKVSEDGNTLTFTTPVMDVLEETVTISYYVENRGQYDAKFTGITCKPAAGSDAELVKYITVTPAKKYNGTTLAAMNGSTPTQTDVADTIEVKLTSAYSSDELAEVVFECTLTAEAEDAQNN